VGKHVLGVIEAAYDVTRSRSEWLQAIATEAYPHLGAGMGILGFDYTVSAEFQVRVGEIAQVSMPHDLADSRRAHVQKLPPDFVRRTFTRCECTTQRDVMDADPLVAEYNRPHADAFARKFGVRDILMVGGMDPSGNGIYLGAWLPSRRKLSRTKKRIWCRIAAHLVSALRVRKRLDQAPVTEGADAILTPQGRVDEARGEASEQVARAALREAVRKVERARSAVGRRDPDGAVAEWKALVDGRWSLVEHFEAGGRRYLIARRNDVPLSGYAQLSDREHQVVAHAALGHSNKLIAYELGLADSTVRVLLFRAATKFGVTRRKDLIEKFLAERGR
jgi:DNA-binding CsgD family transcriptional regulator